MTGSLAPVDVAPVDVARLDSVVATEYEAIERRVRSDMRRIGFAAMGVLVVVVLGLGLPLIVLVIVGLLGAAVLLAVTVVLIRRVAGRRVEPARDVLHWVARYERSRQSADGSGQSRDGTVDIDPNEQRRVEAHRLVTAAASEGLTGVDPIALLVQGRTVLDEQVREFETADDVAFRRRAFSRGIAFLAVAVASLVTAALVVGRLADVW